MSNSFLKRFDRRAHRMLKQAGVADDALYTGVEEGDLALPARVYLDKSREVYGEAAQTFIRVVTARILREDIEDPVVGSLLEVGTEAYRLEKLLSGDEGTTEWVLEEVLE